MEINISGLKCDTKHCNYRDDEVTFAQYPQSIGKPCPVCGKSLLTQEDYDKCLKMIKVVETANKIKAILNKFNPLRWLFKNKKPKPQATLSVKFKNGGGIETKLTKDE